MDINLSLIWQGIGAVAAAGAAYGGVKQALNGTVKKVEGIDEKMDQHISETRVHREETVQRLTAVETEVAHVKERLN